MIDKEDFWAEEDFEDTVAAALIACYETKPKKWKGYAPSDRMNDDRLAILRNAGPYIASNSRYLIIPKDGGFYDTANDPMPSRGLHAFRPSRNSKIAASHPETYLCLHYFRPAETLGKYWKRRGAGSLYELILADAEHDGITGGRRYVTLAKDGAVTACDQEIPGNLRGTAGERTCSAGGHPAEWLQETAIWASTAMQSVADRRFCWTITAQESQAKAHLGCMQEEVKSLLYARSLPMTATGRKRPILHLVEAHKRRIKEGTDVDVTAFLRGQQTVEIGGTVFSVNPPKVIRNVLSKQSQARYFGETA